MTYINIGTGLELSAAPHVLISGSTGSGKSVCLSSIIVELLKTEPRCYMYFVDIKRVELKVYKNISQCKGYSNDIETAAELLNNVHRLMMLRFQYMESKNMRMYPGKHAYIFIDELADLTTQSKEISNILVSIARLGRAARVHIIAACQHCTREIISTQFRYNMPTRILFRTTQNASKLLLEHAGAEKLTGAGHGIILHSNGMETEYHNILVTDEEITKVINENRRKPKPEKHKKKSIFQLLTGI